MHSVYEWCYVFNKETRYIFMIFMIKNLRNIYSKLSSIKKRRKQTMFVFFISIITSESENVVLNLVYIHAKSSL